ncbi:MAG: hypothetical protein KBE65_01985 [Phycisphaerae bacterium]|nr:hypothetical protein [Phycisphaerae bacterium]
MTNKIDTITLVYLAHSNENGHKKPDSKQNLASEEGDEKLLVGLRKALCSPAFNIVQSKAESLTKTEDREENTLSLREFKK